MFKCQNKLRKKNYSTHKQNCNILHFRNPFRFLMQKFKWLPDSVWS